MAAIIAGLMGLESCGDDFSGNLPPEVILPQGAVLKGCAPYSFDFAANRIQAVPVADGMAVKCQATLSPAPKEKVGDFAPASYDPDGRIGKFYVDWGDVSAGEESDTGAFQHVYVEIGYHTIVVTVVDDKGDAAQGSTAVLVF